MHKGLQSKRIEVNLIDRVPCVRILNSVASRQPRRSRVARHRLIWLSEYLSSVAATRPPPFRQIAPLSFQKPQSSNVRAGHFRNSSRKHFDPPPPGVSVWCSRQVSQRSIREQAVRRQNLNAILRPLRFRKERRSCHRPCFLPLGDAQIRSRPDERSYLLGGAACPLRSGAPDRQSVFA